MRVGLLTCTGGRPETFALTERYMARQTYPYHVWTVVDDVDPETPLTCRDQVSIRPTPRWRPKGGHTLKRNMIAGIDDLIDRDVDLIAIIEDDDWYAPNYLQRAAEEFRADPKLMILGERDTLYYHVGCRQWRKNWHPGHASLFSVVFRHRMLGEIREITEWTQRTGIDFSIFKSPWPEGSVKLLTTDLCVGIKGAPCVRAGIGLGHKRLPHSGIPDPNMEKLRELIGDDVSFYEGWFVPNDFVAPKKPEKSRPKTPAQENITQRRRERAEARRAHREKVRRERLERRQQEIAK